MKKPHAPNDGLSMRTALVPMLSMSAFQVMASASILTLPVFAVPLALDVGISAGWVGFYMAIVAFGAMCGAMFGGQLVRRFGPIRVAQLCLGLAASCLVILTFGHALALFAATLMIGLAYGPPTPTSSHLLARTTPPRLMPFVFSVKQTGVPAGGALAGALVPPMVLLWGWQGAALGMAGLCLAVALGLQGLRSRLDDDRDPRVIIWGDVLAPLRVVLGSPRLRRMGFISFCFSSVQMSMIAYLVAYLMEAITLSLVQAGMVLAVAQMAGIVGRIFWGMVCGGRLTPRRLLVGLGFGMALASALAASFTPQWPLLALSVAAAVYGATAVGWNGVFLADVARMSPPGQAGLVAGGIVFITFAGVMTGPLVISLLIAAGLGYASGFWLLMGLSLLGTGLLAIRWPGERD